MHRYIPSRVREKGEYDFRFFLRKPESIYMENRKQRRLLFSVTLKDCRVDTFRAGGKGGQHQNKVETGVRIVHLASGAVGESRDSRSQYANKIAAFTRMAGTKTFQYWQRAEAAKRLGMRSPEEVVDEMMCEEFIKVEVRGDDGRWQEA